MPILSDNLSIHHHLCRHTHNMSAFHAPMEWCAYTGIYDSCGEHNLSEGVRWKRGGGAGMGTKKSGGRIFFCDPVVNFEKVKPSPQRGEKCVVFQTTIQIWIKSTPKKPFAQKGAVSMTNERPQKNVRHTRNKNRFELITNQLK